MIVTFTKFGFEYFTMLILSKFINFEFKVFVFTIDILWILFSFRDSREKNDSI